MKKRQNTSAKIVAFIALLAIVIGIIGTGALVIVNSFSGANSQVELTQEQIDEYLKTLSGTTLEADGVKIQTGEELIESQGDINSPEENTEIQENTQELEADIQIENNIDVTNTFPDIVESLQE